MSTPSSRRPNMLVATLLVVCVAWVADAQPIVDEPTRLGLLRERRLAKSEQLTPERVSDLEHRVRWWEQSRLPMAAFEEGFRGVRPVFGGMPAGSGLVVGAGYVSGLTSDHARVTVDGRYSTLDYRALDAELVFPTPRSGSPLRFHVRAGYRDFKELNFFGLGNAASRDDRTTYRIEDRTVGGGVIFVPHRDVEIGGDVSLLDGRIVSGTREPSLEERFDPDQVQGFGADPEFLVVGGHAQVQLKDQGFPRVGVTLRVEAARYESREEDPFDFTRIAAEAQAYAPLGARSRRLAFRIRTSHSMADRGQRVPFHLMETIGGAKTLRGFREYRYRDQRNLLLNLEYRWEVWNYLDFALFGDAAKVFADADQLDLTDLQASYGFGFRGFGPRGATFRMDFAKSNEGFILHIGGGPSF